VAAFPDVRFEEAAAVIATALARHRTWLEPADVTRLLGCYGLPLPRAEIVKQPKDAAAAAARIGGAVALKAVAPTLLHKTEVGAVETSLEGADQVGAAAERMAARVRDAGHELRGFMVQEMAPAGVEMLVGVVHDPLFGPVVACGAGGVQAELLKDVAVRLTPLTDRDARQMVTSLRTYPLLDGFRGAPKADAGALQDVVLRIGALVENHPEIAEMDCNPVIVSADGALIVDARIRVEDVAPTGPEPALRA